MASSPVLAFYDPKLDTKVSADASQYRMDTALLQLHDSNWQPMAYGSRVLMDTETRYIQIKREGLGVMFGCEYFHDIIYGGRVTAETDHKTPDRYFQEKLA